MVGNRRVEGTQDRRSEQREVLRISVSRTVLGTAQERSAVSQVVPGAVYRVPGGPRDRLPRPRWSHRPSAASRDKKRCPDAFWKPGGGGGCLAALWSSLTCVYRVLIRWRCSFRIAVRVWDPLLKDREFPGLNKMWMGLSSSSDSVISTSFW